MSSRDRVIAAAVALAASVAVLAQQPKLSGRYFTRSECNQHGG